jgi:hypothetical protein
MVDVSENTTVRPIPYPYEAMLSICSDLDETPDRVAYARIMQYLNTNELTPMGDGVGLEVGNTIYFDMPPGQFAYENTDEAGREMIRELIHAGLIDCLHSYGDRATTRAHAARAIDELVRHGCRLSVWVDHATAPSNFGADIMRGRGDVVDDDVYHADLTCEYGIKYVWRGRVTSIVGQDVARSLAGIVDVTRPAVSLGTATKEAMKGWLARCGSTKYAMHGWNRVCRSTTLRDGRPVIEFMRCNPYWGGVGRAATADGLAEVMTNRFLDRLCERKGACILYTHLGKIQNEERPFSEPTRRALRRLAEQSERGRILVWTTARLLNYQLIRDHLEWTAERRGARTVVTLGDVIDPVAGRRAPRREELQGLSFELPPTDDVELRMASGESVSAMMERLGEKTILHVPRRPLKFPELSPAVWR